ncbi:hypothetical protein TNCV_4362281 [Trichonephila clavipes]|nr:hypothetical protein TNCV_4362281 [Trichonephila clavipes]
MVLKANDRRTSCPCHDEFRGPRSDYVRQVALATTTTTTPGQKIYENCTKCNLVQATPDHLLFCAGLDREDIYSSPLLVYDFLRTLGLMYPLTMRIAKNKFHFSLFVLDESRSFFRVHTGYFSNIPKCIKAEFIASWACSQSSVVSSSKR